MTAAKARVITVRATAVGYHGGRLREVGEVFGYEVAAGVKLPRWVVAARRKRAHQSNSTKALSQVNQVSSHVTKSPSPS
jgi:hypothetical protein